MTLLSSLLLCSRCHERQATRMLPSATRHTYFCDICEPTTVAALRRLVRLDDPRFAKPAPPAHSNGAHHNPRDMERIGQLEEMLEAANKRISTLEFEKANRRAGHMMLEHSTVVRQLQEQLAEGSRAYDDLKLDREMANATWSAKLEEAERQLRAAEMNAADWQAKAEEYKGERDGALERLGKAAGSRDEALAEVQHLKRRLLSAVSAPRPAPAPAPVPQIQPVVISHDSTRRRLTELVASIVPLKGVRSLVVPMEMDLLFGVLPGDNRSKIAHAIRDYLCGRRNLTRARGLADDGRQLYTLNAGKFTITVAGDERGELTIHDLGQS